MTKRALGIAAGMFALCAPLFAQTLADLQTADFGLMQPSLRGFSAGLAELPYSFSPSPEFGPTGRFSLSSAFLGIGTAPEILPSLAVESGIPRSSRLEAKDAPESGAEIQNIRHRLFDYAGGEVGFSYGRSTGKYGGEVTRTYILGEVGNDKIHIIAGASYEEASVRFPSRGR
ncbi:MAG: hypothetical protein ACR2HH_03630 [Chthoniobacterales bacterium]